MGGSLRRRVRQPSDIKKSTSMFSKTESGETGKGAQRGKGGVVSKGNYFVTTRSRKSEKNLERGPQSLLSGTLRCLVNL